MRPGNAISLGRRDHQGGRFVGVENTAAISSAVTLDSMPALGQAARRARLLLIARSHIRDALGHTTPVI